MNPNDITIAFSGYNIKNFALLAIESFLKIYPNFRSSVVYFDDDSTDGTSHELMGRGIKVITWTKELRDEFSSYKFKPNTTLYTSSRVSFIMREIMQQTQTKYLLINDGDVFFKKGGFLELYMSSLKDCRILFYPGKSNYTSRHIAFIKNIDELAYDYYSKYQIESYESKPNFPLPEDGVIYSSVRVHMMHVMMDLDYFKYIGMLGDRLCKHTFSIMQGGLVDTGTDFYHQIMERGVSHREIGFELIKSSLDHWGWISSSNRIQDSNSNKERNINQELQKKLTQPYIKKLIDELNLDVKAIVVKG